MSPLVWASLAIAALGPSPSGMQAIAPAVSGAAQKGGATSLTSVRVNAGASGPIVSLEAHGPLPMPTRAVLENPPRVYFDLNAVTARTSITEASDGVIARVRVALHSADPVVTRVVIDLKQPATYSVDASQRLAGRIDISFQAAEVTRSLGATVSPGTARAATAAPSLPAGADRAAAAAATRRPAGVQRYLARMSPLMQRLDAVRPVLASIDARSAIPPDRVDGASAEIADLRKLLASISPPRAMATAHGMLMNACSLGSTALSLVRASKDAVISWDAASAAAGALILLDRARTELAAQEP